MLKAEWAMSSFSAQQLANFTLLHYDKSTSARTSPCFLYLIAECSSLYVAKRAPRAFLIVKSYERTLHFYNVCGKIVEMHTIIGGGRKS